MHAVVIAEAGGPDVLTWTEVPDPGPPGPDDVLVRVVATAVNRADLLQRQGRYPPPAGSPPYPGLECSGVVEAVGSDVTAWSPGDEVVALLGGGGYAEQVVAPAGQVMPCPEGVDLVSAAALPEVVCTVWSNVFMLAGLRHTETLLVHGGASGIGTMAVQLARVAGSPVIVTARNAARIARCLELGAVAGINHREEDFVARTRELTHGHGVDVVLDNMGASYLGRNVEALATNGRIVVVGLQGGTRAELDLGALMAKRAAVLSTSLRIRPPAEKAAICRSVVENVWPLLAKGEVRPVVDRVLPLSEAAAAHRAVEAGEHVGKVVLANGSAWFGPAAAFFLQMFFILACCRAVGWAARKIGQPQVVGEMIAGVLIGPSLLGLAFPAIQKQIFPADSLNILYVGAQLGVGLYMFLVGAEFKTEFFRARIRSAASVSAAGMLVPFACAVALAPWLKSVPGLFSAKATNFEATLFLGAAISITAFPMLARIIYERGMTGTPLGTLALSAGAIDDAAAWCVLAIVLASFQKRPDGTMNPAIAVKAIGGGLGYVILMIVAGRKMLAPLGRLAEREGKLSLTLISIVLMLFCLAAWAMDAIGIHAVFGGFLLGTAMPRGFFATELRKKLEPLTVVFLLPMFFTYSGLKTRLDMVNSMPLLLIAVVIIAASIFGKGIACWAAARLNGEDNRTSLAVGTLMNSRGLMELIIINIGLQKGVIESGLFSILVLMAIVTTLMATPLFELVYGRQARKVGELAAAPLEA